MRVLPPLFLAITLCGACTPQQNGNDANAAAPAQASPAAKEAQALAQRYMTLVNAKDYVAARAMWGHGGADVGGSAADFARTFDIYSQYRGEAGEPTEVKTTAGEQFVAVAAKANVTLRKTGEKRVLTGLIRLRRSIGESATDPGQKKWSIWGIDLRKPH